MIEKFSNLRKILSLQEIQQSSQVRNRKKTTIRHFRIKLLKTRNKEKILKGDRREKRCKADCELLFFLIRPKELISLDYL